MGFPSASVGKEPACNVEDARGIDSIPGWEDPLEKGTATTPVFSSGESHGQRSLVSYRPWSCKESDMTEVPEHSTAELVTYK